MKVIRNKIIPFKGYKAVNVFGVLFVRKGVRMRRKDYTHEEIHTEQMKELLYVGFYVWYVLEWLVRLFMCGFKAHEAYRKVSFEREAYGHETDSGYPKSRERFGFLNS